MVDGISGVNTGSIKDLPVYQQYYQDYLEFPRFLFLSYFSSFSINSE